MNREPFFGPGFGWDILFVASLVLLIGVFLSNFLH